MTVGAVVFSSSVDESEEEEESGGEGWGEGGSGVFLGLFPEGGDSGEERERRRLALAAAARVCSGMAVEGVREDGRMATRCAVAVSKR